MDNRPIGVFDSGLGGLTVVKELMRILPGESIVYFGDTGRVPYGTRSRETIYKYANQDINFLLSHNVKMIIAACGTVSSVLPDEVFDSYNIPFIGVLKPACHAAAAATTNKKIGVLGTSATVNSKKAETLISGILPDASVFSVACPLFVPLVENGFIEKDNEVTTLVARKYLSHLVENQTDTIILGCTHFPIIKAIIGKEAGENVRLIDPGKEAVHSAKELLERQNLLSDGINPEISYYVSDSVENFEAVASIFLNTEISGEKVKKVHIEAFETEQL